jgi:hypothetical protein
MIQRILSVFEKPIRRASDMASQDMLREEGLLIRLESDRILVESDVPLSDGQRRFFRQHRCEIMAELRADLHERVRTMAAWWQYDDQELADALYRSHDDPAGWLSLVKHHEQLTTTPGNCGSAQWSPGRVSCATCRHFETAAHPHLGHCNVGEPEAVAGLWCTEFRDCSQWLLKKQRAEVEAVGR